MKTLLTTVTIALSTALASTAMAAPTAYQNKVEVCNESRYVVNVRVPASTNLTMVLEPQNCHSFPFPSNGRGDPDYIHAYVSYSYDRYVETEVTLYNGDTVNVNDPDNYLRGASRMPGAAMKPSSKVKYTVKHA